MPTKCYTFKNRYKEFLCSLMNTSNHVEKNTILLKKRLFKNFIILMIYLRAWMLVPLVDGREEQHNQILKNR